MIGIYITNGHINVFKWCKGKGKEMQPRKHYQPLCSPSPAEGKTILFSPRGCCENVISVAYDVILDVYSAIIIRPISVEFFLSSVYISIKQVFQS
jgi:hypothetical protein